jgi:hypothetical protein
MMLRSVTAAFAACALVPAAATAASPVRGSVFGPVVAVKGTTFTITTSLSPSGKSAVSTASARITEQAAAPRSSLAVGACVGAAGTRNSKGAIAATRITISQAVKGQCASGFAFRRGTRPGGTGAPPNGRRPPGGFGGNASFGFAFGSVTKVSGSTLTVRGRSFGSTSATTTTTVTVSSKTTLLETKTVKPSAIAVKECAFVQGTSADKGITVKATSISLTPEANGACNAGFRGPGR